jgi:polyphosphate kinase
LVRGICALRPGVEGLSENIRVRSILGRFLEHSRVFVFGGGGDPIVFIGSADMMHRNLDRRVEALVRLIDPRHISDLKSLVGLGMSDEVSSWHLSGDGTWTRHRTDDNGKDLLELQSKLIENSSKRRAKARRTAISARR